MRVFIFYFAIYMYSQLRYRFTVNILVVFVHILLVICNEIICSVRFRCIVENVIMHANGKEPFQPSYPYNLHRLCIDLCTCIWTDRLGKQTMKTRAQLFKALLA